MRIARFGILGALVLGAIGCQTDDGGPTTPNIPPLAFVRYINAVPDTFNTTVRFIDQLSFTPQTFINVPYRGLGQGGYQGLRAGSRRLRVFTWNPNLNSQNSTGASTAQLADTTFDFVAGQYYTLLHWGYARAGQVPAQRVLILNDVLPAVSATTINVRGLNATLGLGPVTGIDFAVAAVNVFTNVGIGAASAFSSRAPAALTFSFSATGVATALASAAAPAGTAGTTTADPLAGATVGGSVLTAIAFGPSVTGSPAAASATPSIIWFQDRQPPRTTP
jgi:hypothetical protein